MLSLEGNKKAPSPSCIPSAVAALLYSPGSAVLLSHQLGACSEGNYSRATAGWLLLCHYCGPPVKRVSEAGCSLRAPGLAPHAPPRRARPQPQLRAARGLRCPCRATCTPSGRFWPSGAHPTGGYLAPRGRGRLGTGARESFSSLWWQCRARRCCLICLPALVRDGTPHFAVTCHSLWCRLLLLDVNGEHSWICSADTTSWEQEVAFSCQAVPACHAALSGLLCWLLCVVLCVCSIL